MSKLGKPIELNMREFRCSKCLQECVGLKYVKAETFEIPGLDKTLTIEEHFECNCHRCGYTWKENVKLQQHMSIEKMKKKVTKKPKKVTKKKVDKSNE